MASPNLNYYETLGLNQSATATEVRRAYRILARRYHPDLNPGKASEDRFKQISLAYQNLSDPEKRRNYDSELDSAKKIRAGFAAYEKAQKSFNIRDHYKKNKTASPSEQVKAKSVWPFKVRDLSELEFLKQGVNKIYSFWRPAKQSGPQARVVKGPTPPNTEVKIRNVSVVEMSVLMKDAIFGGRKSVEVTVGGEIKKLSVRISAGVRSGSVIRLTSGTAQQEDYILILKVAPHPMLEIAAKGLVINIPVSVSEALFGGPIKVPGLESEETISVPPGSQSGDEIRLTQKGIKFDGGQRGDLFYRLMIQIPSSSQAVGINEKVKSFSEYYESQPRAALPLNLIDHLA